MILEYILNAFCILALTFLWTITLKNYKTLPTIIPVHFDLDGNADRHGNKRMMFFGPVFCTVFFAFVLWVSQFPESFNFPVKINEGNAERQEMIAKVFVKWLAFILTLIFINSQEFLLRFVSNPSAKARFSLFSILAVVFLSVAAVIIVAAVLK
ncbi:hypothetical protein ASG01_08220 [Chryseobacterium sp. Leaf180]|uniref:DUF1648 domain-containing protein n=1 Tax=Chryseobacterium sp. Leaf180 TaxID=1736289 RepID=UPI0006F77359|nr:DUF1648 domain-containing protein [Chryseobacterium sp. Leaf180]KQR93837.1 hypothetical protein ASG01_08220 [Chryseobacterium sp. Leaf180]